MPIDCAFSGCSSLTNVYITDIAAWCKISFHNSYANPSFYAHNLYLNNELVTELIIPDGVTNIGDYAFSGCSSLTSITIPNSVKRISDSAFANCTSVTEILFNATNCADFASTNNVFASVGAKEVGVSLNIGKNVTRIPAYFAGGYSKSYIKSILFEDESLCESIGTMAFYNCGITSLTIPETVTYIGNMAFAYCNDLMEVNYYAENCVAAEPKALSGDGIFYGSGNNVKLTIGATVKNIENVFSIYNNYSQYKLDIESVYYLGTVEQWCQINFNREPLTKNLHIGGELVENIVISSAVTKINDYAFWECTSLKSVVIESGVQEVGYGAFYGCSSLTEVYYNGTQTEWANGVIGTSNLTINSDTLYFFSEQAPNLNLDSTAYDGNYWHYVDGIPTIWVYTPEE